MDKHAQRIDIFNSTLELIGQGWYMAPDGSKVELPPVEEVMAAAKMYDEHSTYYQQQRDVDLAAGCEFVPTEVRVENKDCVLAAKALIDAGYYRKGANQPYNNDWTGTFTGKDGRRRTDRCDYCPGR